ncbi:MAG: hypothetical protein E6I96_08415 [Chloroflexi bacterium]|nr:MAG: hypothetical protein E6I96_08415 [Chloroflexota bacterium]
MSTPQPAQPQISPDGHYWWDGQAWQPMPTAPGPAAGQPAWLDQPPTWLAAPPDAPAPAPPAPVAEQPSVTPAWTTPAPPSSRLWIYMTGLLLIVIIAIGAVAVYGQLNANTNTVASVQVSPTPLISDYERADRFLNVDLGPSLVEANQALPGVTSKCTSTLPPPCKDALIALDKAMVEVDNAMTSNQRDIPPCIGRPVQQFKDDWTGMEQGVALAISGYDANSRTLILQGLQKFAAIAQYLKPDVDRISKAEQVCSKTV